MKVYYHSSFTANSFGHGGERRTAQIKDILLRNGIQYKDIEIDPSIRFPLFRKIITAFTIIPFFFITGSISAFKREIHEKLKYRHYLKTLSELENSILIWESVIPVNWLILDLAKALNCRVIAIPQNLETLVPTGERNRNNKKSLSYFNSELELLSGCDHVFAISREEQWLLGLFGVKASFLPYYPCEEAEKHFLNIREKRLKLPVEERNLSICIGTAYNPPTLLGMVELIHQFETNSHQIAGQLFLAGYGTEILANQISRTDIIQLLGGISQDKADELHLKAKLSVLTQAYSTGALTKVPETILMGVPILLNTPAARTYFNLDGVYVFVTTDELFAFLKQNLKIPNRIYRPLNYEQQFADIILCLAD